MNHVTRLLALVSVAVIAACSTTPPPLPPAPVPDPPQPTAGAISTPSSSLFLFGDLKARSVGDVLTVILVENTTASKSASTSVSKESEVALGVPTWFGRAIPRGEVGIEGERDFAGTGSSNQSNQLNGQITVRVVEKMGNGNLRIRGRKQLTLNRGEEFIHIEGIVRSHDITPSNTVRSPQIANAKISYSGRGSLADANTQGWLSRFFNSAIWPF